MAAVVDEFSLWLGNKLQALNTDENVFGTYITGILDGDESVEEKTEAIQELLAEIIVSILLSNLTFIRVKLFLLNFTLENARKQTYL